MKTMAEIQKMGNIEIFIEKSEYFSNEYQRIGNSHCSWYILYNDQFEIMAEGHIRFTNLITNLSRIVPNSKMEAKELLAYELVASGNPNYLIVKRTENTSASLKSIAASLI